MKKYTASSRDPIAKTHLIVERQPRLALAQRLPQRGDRFGLRLLRVQLPSGRLDASLWRVVRR
jgi:hypothetical protein